jgi:hypothetical protein
MISIDRAEQLGDGRQDYSTRIFPRISSHVRFGEIQAADSWYLPVAT